MSETSELPARQAETPSQAEQPGPTIQQSGYADDFNGSEWDLATKRTVLVILLVAMAGVIWISRPIIPLLVVSGIIAYLLSPIVDVGERLRIPRSLSTIVLFVLMLVGIILLPVWLVPVIIRQLSALANFDVPSTARSILNWFNQRYYSLPDTIHLLGFELTLGDALRQMETNVQQINIIPSLAEVLSYFQQLLRTATTVVGGTAIIGFNVVGGIFQAVFAALIVFFISLYLTKDAPQIRAYIAGLFPSAYQSEVGDVLRRMGFIWAAFFRGQIILSLTVGVLTWGALTLAGMPGALILAILAGALEIIPNIGPTLAMIPAIIVALTQGSTVLAPLGVNNFAFALITVAIYFIIQQLENNILVPRVIGYSVNLHPVVIIVGIAVGLQVGGILGAFLAAPVIATLRVLGSYIHAKLLGYPPFLGQDLPNARRRMTYRRTVKGDLLQSESERALRLADGSAVEGTDDSRPEQIDTRPQADSPAGRPSRAQG